MIEGDRVRLRPVEETDAETLHGWATDPDTWRWVGPGGPPSLQDIKDAEAQARLAGHPFLILDGSHPVGRISIEGIVQQDRRAAIALLIGEPAAYDDGRATDALRTLVGFAFANLDLHLLELRCLDVQVGVQRAAEAAGFRRDAVLRDRAWRDGRWCASVVMSVTRDERDAGT